MTKAPDVDGQDVPSPIAELLRDALPAPLRILELGRCVSGRALHALGTSRRRCSRCAGNASATAPPLRFVLGDFTRDAWTDVWTDAWDPPFDAVVAMQAVHEVRHKRHVPRLYAQLRALLRPGGTLVVCDHAPPDDSARLTALHSTEHDHTHSYR